MLVNTLTEHDKIVVNSTKLAGHIHQQNNVTCKVSTGKARRQEKTKIVKERQQEQRRGRLLKVRERQKTRTDRDSDSAGGTHQVTLTPTRKGAQDLSRLCVTNQGTELQDVPVQ